MNWEHDRERGYEQQFAQQEEQAFLAAAHRNRLFALWAARQMKLGPDATGHYIEKLVPGDVAHLRGAAVVDQVIEDLRNAGVPLPRTAIQREFDRLTAEAKAAFTS